MGPDCFTLNECSRRGAWAIPRPLGGHHSFCFHLRLLHLVIVLSICRPCLKSPQLLNLQLFLKKKKKFQIFWKYGHLMTKQKHFSYNSQILPQRKSINPQSDTKMIQIPPTQLWLINGETKVIGLNERCQASQRWCSLHGGLWSLKGGGMCNI